jgi:2,4-dienoyl-CoA reductase (NADPH2)
VNVCIACNQCIDASIFDRRVSCAVNPRAGFETAEGVDGGGVRVAVAGGGPAGMEAARSLAQSGFAVTLFEAAGQLGGQFRMACRIPGKEDFARTGEYFAAELAQLGVDVRLGARAEVAALAGFDAVVVATGVLPRPLALPGAGLPHVLSYARLLTGEGDPREQVGERVVVIGAGGIGVDVAHLLSFDPATSFHARYGLEADWTGRMQPVACIWPVQSGRAPREVTLMRRSGRIGAGVGPSTRWVVVEELRRAGVELLTGVSYERIDPEAVLVVAEDGTRRRVAADSVVVAAGQEPDRTLADALAAAGRPHVVVGGARDASGLDAGRAFREGFAAPAAVVRVLAARDRGRGTSGRPAGNRLR